MLPFGMETTGLGVQEGSPIVLSILASRGLGRERKFEPDRFLGF